MNIGNSTTHKMSWRPSGIRPKRRPSSSRNAPSACPAVVAWSATISSRSPSDASRRELIAAISCSERNFAIGERQPSGSGIDPAHDAAGLEHAREHLELRAGHGGTEVLQLEPEARVWP